MARSCFSDSDTRLVKVHEHGDERGLAVGGHKGYDLVLDGLHAATNLVAQTLLHNLVRPSPRRALNAKLFELASHLAADLLAADLDERRQMRQRDGLAAVLADDATWAMICVAMLHAVEKLCGLLDERTGDNRAVLQHVFQVHQVAVVHVLREVVRVVEVDDALVVGVHDIGRQQARAGA